MSRYHKTLTKLIALPAIVAAIGTGTIAMAGDRKAIHMPHSIIGDWYSTSVGCGSPEAEASGVIVSSDGVFELRNGYERCAIQHWIATPLNVLGKSALGAWSFTAICTTSLRDNSALNRSQTKKSYGKMTLKTSRDGKALVLYIDQRDNGGTIFDAPVNLRGNIVQRCKEPGPPTHYGWAMPPKKQK